MARLKFLALFLFFVAGPVLPSIATAGPPSYLLLRDPESPGPRHQPGYAASKSYDVRSYGYAYGYFGVAPRTHCSRHFGIYRLYTQWTRW